MITKTGKELKNIEKSLAYILANVRLSNSSGRTDINIELERLIKNLLNLVCGLNFELTSSISSTYPAIDLVDRRARVACQVTSTNSVKKLKDTIKKFDQLGMSKDFDELKFFIISDKNPPKISKVFGELGTRCTVLTIKKLNLLIQSMDDEGKISKINTLFVGQELLKPLVDLIKKNDDQFVKLGSIKRLLDQACLDIDVDTDEVEQYVDDVKSFTHEIAELSIEQRTVLCDLIWKAHSQVGSLTCLYLEESEILVEFSDRERLIVSSLVSKNLVEWDEEFCRSYIENPVVALLVIYKSESEQNIFIELKKAAKKDRSILKGMVVDLDFSILE